MDCPSCGSRDIEFIESSGHRVCVQCGTVLEENAIVSSVEFQECGDRSHVVGQFVSASSSKYGSSSRGHSRYGFSRESRDATLSNAKRVISQVSSSMRLPPYFTEHAHRLYSLALDNKFVYGRRQVHIVATVLYIICRQEKSPHLLIDFSDALQVNVYTIGKTFLQLIRILNLKMPVVDPCLYIHRFVTRLDLGEKMGNISTTALRIVTRMKKDWINTGRRPDGVCAAALLIACRSYDIHKSISEIAGLFRITEVTLKRRLNDFKNTPSAHLTVEQFHQHDFNFELDPPTYLHAQQMEAGKNNQQLVFNIQGNSTIEDVNTVSSGQPQNDNDEEQQGGVKSGADVINISVDEAGRRSQVLQVGDVEILAQLPQALVEEDGDSDGDEKNEDGESHKRKRLSAKGQERNMRRKELYGQIYSEIGEAVEQNIHDNSKSNDAAISISSNHLQSQADLLFLEAQAVGKQKGKYAKGRITAGRSQSQIYVPPTPASAGGVGVDTVPSSQTLQTTDQNDDENEGVLDDHEDEYIDHSSARAAGSLVFTKSQYKRSDDDNDDFVMSDAELESFILTSDEQEKRSALWEKMHRPFLDEQQRKRAAKLSSSASASVASKTPGRVSGRYISQDRGGIDPREGKVSFGDGATVRGMEQGASVVGVDVQGMDRADRVQYGGVPSDISSGAGVGSWKGGGATASGGGGRKIVIGATVGGGGQVSRSRVGVAGSTGRSVSFRPHGSAAVSDTPSSRNSSSSSSATSVSSSTVVSSGDGSKANTSDRMTKAGRDSNRVLDEEEEDDDEEEAEEDYDDDLQHENDDYEQEEDDYGYD